MPTTHDSRLSPLVIQKAITLSLSLLLLLSCHTPPATVPVDQQKSPRALEVSMMPMVMTAAPADVRLVVKVAAYYANRRLTFVLDGPEYRSSEEMLEGEDAPRTRVYWFKAVPAGRYGVGVALERSDGTAPVIWQEGLCVRGIGESCGMEDGGR